VSAWPAGVGVIGAGAMGRAMAAGLVRARPGLAEGLRFADALPAAAEAAAAEVGGRVAGPAEAGAADLVCLAVKPKDVEAALSAARPGASDRAVLLSVVMGASLDRLAAAAPGVPLVRTMPNLAVRSGFGVVAVASRDLPPEREAELLGLLQGLGAVVPLPEALFAAATAVVGSGPGFVALVAEGLEEGAVAVGLARADARAMVRGVLVGTASLLDDDEDDPAALRQRVTSPAGSTAEGLARLERGAVRAHLADAVRAAAVRAADTPGAGGGSRAP
jgi:pyrroline-5-carboxylate reductase